MGTRLTGRERLARAFSEDALEREVAQRCQVLGIYRYHTLRPIGSEAGFPDDVLVGTTVLYRELKREVGSPVTPAQRAVHDRLRAAGADVDVWRPSDLLSGRIDRELLAIRPQPATLGRRRVQSAERGPGRATRHRPARA